MNARPTTEIIYGDYRIEHEVNCTSRFNLWKTSTSTVKNPMIAKITGKEVGEDTDPTEKIMCYGTTLEGAINNIILDKMADKAESYTLRGYIEELRKEKEELLESIRAFSVGA